MRLMHAHNCIRYVRTKPFPLHPPRQHKNFEYPPNRYVCGVRPACVAIPKHVIFNCMQLVRNRINGTFIDVYCFASFLFSPIHSSTFYNRSLMLVLLLLSILLRQILCARIDHCDRCALKWRERKCIKVMKMQHGDSRIIQPTPPDPDYWKRPQFHAGPRIRPAPELWTPLRSTDAGLFSHEFECVLAIFKLFNLFGAYRDHYEKMIRFRSS